ncbi:hypothetical protein HELRODRAFT_179231 [Helobdella robusta]|uniref:RING-type domain-containing protein n=1 Tax=Helobdella robusta TaxID=6412 RepID=T1FEE3_HELRO|nr:hypothetical protein HELRODRAFT_179231 [Helobdella robusta]ESN95463.1 hypothetical protein HELRODRAFT_179231 [Helobdella robusta]
MSSRTEPVLKRKRLNPAVCGGITDSFKTTEDCYSCPICFNILDEPYMTKCGHSFCYRCIGHSLENDNRCPKCGFIIARKEEIFPNFLREFEVRWKDDNDDGDIDNKDDGDNGDIDNKDKDDYDDDADIEDDKEDDDDDDVGIRDLTLPHTPPDFDLDTMDLDRVNDLLNSLYDRRQQLQQQQRKDSNELLREFLEKALAQKQKHEKRCWSVDFNRVDPCLLASGSDDAKVKLWHINSANSIASLQVRANVCGVKFNPDSLYHLAFGSADHRIHYYDLRQMKEALLTLKGHKKAVSYAKFINSNEIVSASTDSQLKLWDLTKKCCTRTYLGHINERNFVGLATDGDYVACDISKAMLSYKFDPLRTVLMGDKIEDESTEFVSAVCWKTGSNVILAANSQGHIKVMSRT